MTSTAEQILDQPIAGENAGFDVFDRGGVPTIELGKVLTDYRRKHRSVQPCPVWFGPPRPIDPLRADRFYGRRLANLFTIARGSSQGCVPLLEIARRRGLLQASAVVLTKERLEVIAKMIRSRVRVKC